MPALPTLKVSEIFWSAQGEGARVGTARRFRPPGGCSLRCRHCDTAYAGKREGD